MWRPVLISVAAIVVVFGLLGWRLHTLTSGLSQPEVETYQATRNMGDLLDNTVNAPYKVAVFVSTKLSNSTFGLRVVNVLVGAISIIVFYMLSRKLFKLNVALATTALFATNSFLLVMSRMANAQVMLLSLLALVAVGFMVRFDRRQDLAWILMCVVAGLSLYVPGMAVIIFLAAVWQFTRIRRSFESLSPAVIIICSVTLSILAAPIVINLIRFPVLWREYMGLPATFARLPVMGREMLRAAGALFMLSPTKPAYWLGRQPILDVFSGVLFIFGLWALSRRFKLDRLWLVVGLFVLIFAWIAVSGDILYLLALLPFIYIVIGFGLQSLLSQWLSVFPRNPIARSVGLILVLSAVALAVNFQLQRYFVAWPHNQQTKAAFDLSLPK